MKCSNCEKEVVLSGPLLCKDHFCTYFEDKVLGAIQKYKMFGAGDKICVAVSGGKDSIVMLDILSKKYKVSALAIDEGISGYREHTLAWLKKYCLEKKIELKMLSFSDAFGETLDDLKKKNPCTECGTRRRELMNKGSSGFDVLAVGHNLDDTAQTILMNLFKFTSDMMPRAMPVSAKSAKFIKRVKPLYYCTEKEVYLYAILNGLAHKFVECPYMYDSFRNDVRDSLNKYSRIEKENIVKKYLSIMG
ncbi:MAG: tRNA 2-thiocytidine biosynthesis TtcA family protein [Nanoarchaeota archaeon]|nr:tRNA 2-thiocytidine biosynthesis TtcA family protein [Nanoarchaeota archaeon]